MILAYGYIDLTYGNLILIWRREWPTLPAGPEIPQFLIRGGAVNLPLADQRTDSARTVVARMVVSFFDGLALGWVVDRNVDEARAALDGFIEGLALMALSCTAPVRLYGRLRRRRRPRSAG